MDLTCCDAVAPPSLTVQVCFPGVRAAVLDNLNRQREEGRLCDLSIQVQGQVFRAHRCVLAASSPYFHDQVLLKNVTTVSLPSVLDPVAFQRVLSSAYTGQLSIVHDDIVNYVTVASFLQMWHIVDKCTEILKRPAAPAAEPGAGSASGSASRQQSPSSTDCLFAEREAGRRRDRKPDALPPLATWRRPQQEARWARWTRPEPEQNPAADSQLDGLPGYPGSPEEEEEEEEEEWSTSKPGPSGQSGRYLVPAGEAPKQKVRFQQQRGEENRDRRRNDARETEADEGVGEEEEEAKGGFTLMGLRVPGGAEDGRRSAGTSTPDPMKVRVQRDDASPDVPAAPPGCSWPDEEDGDLTCFGSLDGTGHVSQRPLLSPDFADWPSSSFPPPSSSSPSSSSPGGGGGAAKLHLCHCGKAYALKSMRDRHVKMQHLHLRPFGCPVCSKSFKMKHHLTKHLKTHGGLRPFECSLCGKKVVWRDSFLRHQARCSRPPAGGAAGDGGGRVKEEDDGTGGGMGGDDGVLGETHQGLGSVGHVFKEEAAERFS